jgi:hypothetical protein
MVSSESQKGRLANRGEVRLEGHQSGDKAEEHQTDPRAMARDAASHIARDVT